MFQRTQPSRALLIAVLLACGVLQANAIQTDVNAKQSVTFKARQQSLNATLHAVEKASWIAEGNGAHVVYIFFDPNCPYCHKLYEELRTRVGQNELQVRWIPVGILLPTSLGKAAAILDAKDPLLALRQNEEKFSATDGFGAVGEAFASPEAAKHLEQNSELLKQVGGQSVPTLLFRDFTGQINVRQGAPSQQKLDALLAQVR